MDNDLQDLENELAALTPVRPSARLESAIEANLAPRRRNGNWAWMALPLAASLALVFAWQSRAPRPVAPPVVEPKVNTSSAASVFKPVATQNLLYAANDDGIVTLNDGRQARRVSRSYVDTVVWHDPQSNASLSWSVPRDEVRLIPVSFQ